jgi:hypothetical protein
VCHEVVLFLPKPRKPRNRGFLKMERKKLRRSRALEMKSFIEWMLIELLKPGSRKIRRQRSTLIKKIVKSLEAFGFIGPIVINDDNEISAGQGRSLRRSARALHPARAVAAGRGSQSSSAPSPLAVTSSQNSLVTRPPSSDRCEGRYRTWREENKDRHKCGRKIPPTLARPIDRAWNQSRNNP